ncbi:MAG: hypothetical protein LBN39_12340, partial [Planctomycetaceae bacterium]|nr:hypothetical protein [Planctomycetaceae bacterium]
MTQRMNRFVLSAVFAVILTLGIRTAFAAEYHIGSNQSRDGSTYFDDLEDFRTTRPGYAQLEDGDNLILYKDDYSLTGQIYVTNNAAARVISSDLSAPRAIGTAPNAQTRHFFLDGGSNTWSKIYFEGIREISGGRVSYEAGGSIYAWWHNDIYTLDLQGVTFRDNIAGIDAQGFFDAGGGAIYYWDALTCDLTDSSFIDNKAVGKGGAMYINASGSLMMSDTTNVTLGASAGRTSTFRGNLDQITLDNQGNYIDGTGQANSIDFTGTWGRHVNLFVKTAEGGTLDMQDPFRTNVSSEGEYTVNILKSGTGTWKLGGSSVIDGSGGTTIAIQEGTLHLYKDAALDARGVYDEFNISEGARVSISGNNTLKGTRVLFAPKSMLTFDLGYYFPAAGSEQTAPVKDSDPMLNLSGTTLQVAGTRIDITGLPGGKSRNGDYLLIQGAAPLEIGNFDLWIGTSNIDVSGKVSQRFGYSLGYKKDTQSNVLDDTQLVLSVHDTDNTVLRLNNPAATQWDAVSKDWRLIRSETEIDSFIPGDTVQFFGDTNRTIELAEQMAFGHNSVGDWYKGKNDTTGMHVSGAGNWTFTGKGIDDFEVNGKASVLFDGSGTLTFANDDANTFTDLVIAGSGTVNVSRGNHLGDGAVRFETYGGVPQDSPGRLVFTGRNPTAVANRILVSGGGNGYITLEQSKTVTFTNPNTENIGGSVRVSNGKLRIQGNAITERVKPLSFAGNSAASGGAVAVGAASGTAELTLDTVVLDGNTAVRGGAAFVTGNNSQLIVDKSEFTGNSATDSINPPLAGNGSGGAVYADGGTVAVSGSTFDSNTAFTDGGAVFGKNANITLTDITAANNVAEGSGGAVYYTGTASTKLTLAATAGNKTSFTGNQDGTGANSVFLDSQTGQQTALVIDAEKDGTVELNDGLRSQTGTAAGSKTVITKTGEGVFLLGAAADLQTDADGTTELSIEQGILQLNSDAANIGNIQFTGAGNGSLTVGKNGTLAASAGNKVSGFSNITLEKGATLGFDLATYDKIAAQPVLILDDKDNATLWTTDDWSQNIDLTALTAGKQYGQYVLMQVDSNTETLTKDNMTLLYRGIEMEKMRSITGTLSLNDAHDTLLLDIDDDPRNGITVWKNTTGNSIWDTESFNWKGTTGGKDDLTGTEQFLHGDAVIFNKEQSGTVMIHGGGVEIAEQGGNPGMVVNGDYTFTGGSIDGEGGVLKQGAGTVTFADVNGYTGGTVAENGTLIVKNVNALGTGSVEIKAAGTTLEFSIGNADSGTFDNQITGNGNVVKSGTGAVRLENKGNET